MIEQLETIKGQIKRKTWLMDAAREYLEMVQELRRADDLKNRLKSVIDTYQADITELENRRREIIQEAAKLPQPQRNVALLRYDAGLTWREIADALGYSLRYVYVLRKQISDE